MISCVDSKTAAASKHVGLESAAQQDSHEFWSWAWCAQGWLTLLLWNEHLLKCAAYPAAVEHVVIQRHPGRLHPNHIDACNMLHPHRLALQDTLTA